MNEHPIEDGYPVPPYHAIITQRYTNVEYDTTGEEELYDRSSDRYELESKHVDSTYADTRSALFLRLHDALEGCKADDCRKAEDGF